MSIIPGCSDIPRTEEKQSEMRISFPPEYHKCPWRRRVPRRLLTTWRIGSLVFGGSNNGEGYGGWKELDTFDRWGSQKGWIQCAPQVWDKTEGTEKQTALCRSGVSQETALVWSGCHRVNTLRGYGVRGLAKPWCHRIERVNSNFWCQRKTSHPHAHNLPRVYTHQPRLGKERGSYCLWLASGRCFLDLWPCLPKLRFSVTPVLSGHHLMSLLSPAWSLLKANLVQ